MAINWLAVIAAAASSFLLGGLWYSALFAKAWQKADSCSFSPYASTITDSMSTSIEFSVPRWVAE